MTRTPPPTPTTHHPHVSLLHWLLDVGMFLFGTPVALWLLISFVLPCGATLMHASERFLAYLQRIEQGEARQAAWLSPAVTLRGHALLAEAWPYHWSQTLVRQLVPQEQDGVFIPSEQPTGEPAPGVSAAAPRPGSPRPDTGHATPAAVAHLSRTAHAWLRDRFFPIQTTWLTTALTRGAYALQLLLIALPACATAYFIGEYRSRVRLGDGHQPMGHRFQWLLRILKYAIASLPAVIVLPLPLPTLAVLGGLVVLTLWCIIHARLHFIEL